MNIITEYFGICFSCNTRHKVKTWSEAEDWAFDHNNIKHGGNKFATAVSVSSSDGKK